MDESTGASLIPHHFLCPLTLEIMRDPLRSKYGHDFERASILDWLDQNDTCPITRQPLSPSMLIPNNSLRLRINAWKGANEVEQLLLEDCIEHCLTIKPRSKQYGDRGAITSTGSKLLILHNEGEIQEIRRITKEEARRRRKVPVLPRH